MSTTDYKNAAQISTQLSTTQQSGDLSRVFYF